MTYGLGPLLCSGGFGSQMPHSTNIGTNNTMVAAITSKIASGDCCDSASGSASARSCLSMVSEPPASNERFCVMLQAKLQLNEVAIQVQHAKRYIAPECHSVLPAWWSRSVECVKLTQPSSSKQARFLTRTRELTSHQMCEGLSSLFTSS